MAGSDRPLHVLSILSNTRAFLLVYSFSAFGFRAEACLAGTAEEDVRHIAARALSGRSSSRSGDNAGDRWSISAKPFHLEQQPFASFRRLIGSLTGKDGAVLLDAELQMDVPHCPGICRCSARMDWNGEEILFPPAASVCFSFSLEKEIKKEQRFGCSCRETGKLAAFCAGTGRSSAFPGQIAAQAVALRFTPGGNLLPAGQAHRSLLFGAASEFGTWYVSDGSPRMLGLKIAPFAQNG